MDVKESINFLEKLNIDKNKYLVVATSGGPDSMTLLHLLKTHNYNVVCAHVNHNLRSVSDEEYIFVENYCKENDIVFEGMKISGYTNNKFTEFEAREKRYAFFEDVLKKYNTDILLTAHHGDDLIETIIMRLIRGSNLKGYKGFSKVSTYKDFKIIRPLIFYKKQDIEKYVMDNNIPCVYDKTNQSKKYTRNRIRLDMLPILKLENKDIHKKFLIFNEELEATQDFLENEVNKNIRDNFKDNILDLNKFNKLHQFMKKKELEKILLLVYKENITLINKRHLDSILKLSMMDGNKSINLPQNIIVSKEYDNLVFQIVENKEYIRYNYVLEKSLEIENVGKIEFVDDTLEKSNYVIKLNSQDITLPIIVRTMEKDDMMEVKNLNGRKSVKKIFVDEKVSKNKRDMWPIVVDSKNQILWIPGIKKSKFDCYNKSFYDIIIKYTKKGE